MTLADLKSTLDEAARRMFGAKVKTRFVPIYFPFIEPSAEMDVSCILCGGQARRRGAALRGVQAARAGSRSWARAWCIRRCSARSATIRSSVTGFAFGMGLERIAMLRHGVPDIRLFLENDLRFLRQFA